MDKRPNAADSGGGTSACCTAGPVVADTHYPYVRPVSLRTARL